MSSSCETATLAQLEAHFGLGAALRFRAGPGGLWFADIDNAQARASLCLQGAHLTAWHPRGQAEPVLWLSDSARYAPGSAIRGGIPLCWPWFGPAAGTAGLPAQAPAHGFARTQAWSVTASGHDAGGDTWLSLQLRDSPQTRALWPHAFVLELRVSVGAQLALTLETHNVGADALLVGEALHSYFRVGDIGSVMLRGLEGARYVDTALGGQPGHQAGPVRFAQETDRVYASGADCVLDDPVLRRRLLVSKRGSGSTVVWNPGAEKAARLGDLGAPGSDDWRRMLCIESANALQHRVSIAAGARHRLDVRLAVEALPAPPPAGT